MPDGAARTAPPGRGVLTAQAFWITAVGQSELRDVDVIEDGDAVTIRTLFSGISRGTERLVFNGQVPPSEHDTMRAPFQDGSFGFPVKYGYSAVGVAENGPHAGATVFALFTHQTRFAVPNSAALLWPEALSEAPI